MAGLDFHAATAAENMCGSGGPLPSAYTPSPLAPAPSRRGALWLLLGLLAVAVLLGVSVALGGEAGQFALAAAETAPFIVLAALLQWGTIWRRLRILAWIAFWLILLGVAVVALGLTASGLMGTNIGKPLAPEQARPLLLGLAAMLLVMLVAVGLSVGGWWLALGRALGGRLEAGNSAHAQGVIGLLVFAIISVIPLFILAGQPPLLALLAANPNALTENRSASGQILDLFYNLAWTIPFAIVAVGFPVRRRISAVLARLGIQPLRRRDIAILVVITVVLVGFGFGLDYAVAALWGVFGWTRTNQDLIGDLFAAQSGSAVGAASAGFTAGVGEELVARGLLQTRFGWLLPNLAFAAAHAYQYGWDALLAVFITGAILAAVRTRWNTSASIVVHGGFDLILFMGSALHWPGF
jgi:uncharacterized protein